MTGFVNELASLEDESKVQSSHALDMMAEIYAEEEGQTEKASKAYDMLAIKFDPIRANYWNYLKSQLEEQQQQQHVTA